MEDKVMYTYYLMVDGEKVIGFNKAFGIVYETETEINDWFTEDGISLYKYVDGEVLERTEAEIEADRNNIPTPEPTPEEIRFDEIETALTEVAEMSANNEIATDSIELQIVEIQDALVELASMITEGA